MKAISLPVPFDGRLAAEPTEVSVWRMGAVAAARFQREEEERT